MCMAIRRYGPYRHRSQGYIFYIDYDTATKRSRTVREHREKMELHLGRALTADEAVHHRDGRRDNNDLSNLEVMTHEDHCTHHKDDGVLADVRGMVKLVCVVCGAEFERHVTAERKRIRHGRGGPFCSRRCVGVGIQMKLGQKRERNADKRFWAKVERGGDDECWIWTGATDSKGIGIVHRLGSRFFAHRVAWEILRGPLDGALLRRRCGNKLCVNPAHMNRHEQE